jgi:hypothetical protein
MDARESACNSHIQRQHFRQLLGNFFRSLLDEDPWWVSLNEPVGNDATTCLTHYLGFEHPIGVQFLCSTGLLKVGNSRNPNATVVVKAEWDKFIDEQGFSGLLEPINQTSISNKRHYFVHFGRRGKLAHRPIDQVKIQRKQLRIFDRQRKFTSNYPRCL